MCQLEGILRSSAAAVTTRTSLPNGFKHNDAVHAWASIGSASTINCYGYTPHNTATYFSMIPVLRAVPEKPIIVSITGKEREIDDIITSANALAPADAPSALEVNLSCPNIPGKPAVSAFCSFVPLDRQTDNIAWMSLWSDLVRFRANAELPCCDQLGARPDPRGRETHAVLLGHSVRGGSERCE